MEQSESLGLTSCLAGQELDQSIQIGSIALKYDECDCQHSACTSDSAESESSQSTFSEMENALTLTLSSNLMFLLGSTSYFILSTIDLRWNLRWGDDDYYYNSYYYPDGKENTEVPKYNLSFYTCLSVGGAILLICNAGFDLYRCISQAKAYGISLYDKDLRGDTFSAVLFGCAASVDFKGSIPNSTTSANGIMASFSPFLYLLSAVSSLSGSSFKCSSKPVVMTTLGEIMFMVASIIDLLISLFPDIFSWSQTLILKLAILSSSLWLIDAILYLFADLLILLRRGVDNEIPRQDKIPITPAGLLV